MTTSAPALGWPWPLLLAALVAYGAAWLAALLSARPARALIGVGIVLHLAWSIWRGVLVGFLPLTNKAESFAAASFALAVVPFVAWHPQRAYALVTVGAAIAAGAAGAAFPQEVQPPGALLRTVWYPLHVPLSFLAFATWVAAGACALAYWRRPGPEWVRRCDRFALQGFGLWSAAMIFGGIWGVVAWGAYFMWDPKIVWSVVLWFHYAAYVHLRLTPALQAKVWLRPALAGVGVFWILFTYVATSLLFAKGSHAF